MGAKPPKILWIGQCPQLHGFRPMDNQLFHLQTELCTLDSIAGLELLLITKMYVSR